MKPTLYYPIKPIRINQAFGQNLSPLYKQQGLLGHPGIDFTAYHGQPVYAAHDGVCYPAIDNHGGNGITLVGTIFTTIYWHLIDDNAVVQTGQSVKAGDLLGQADNTGQSTGDHLHFGLVMPNSPDYNTLNGYQGRIDPTPFFNGLYAQDISNPTPKFQFTKILKIGSWNADTKELQILLNKLQASNLVLDGVFGPKTQLAVKAFQIAHNLVSDGIVGPKTNAVLNTFL